MIIREFKFSRRNIGLFLDELENRLFWFGYETSLGSRSRVTYVIMHSKLFYVWSCKHTAVLGGWARSHGISKKGGFRLRLCETVTRYMYNACAFMDVHNGGRDE